MKSPTKNPQKKNILSEDQKIEKIARELGKKCGLMTWDQSKEHELKELMRRKNDRKRKSNLPSSKFTERKLKAEE